MPDVLLTRPQIPDIYVEQSFPSPIVSASVERRSDSDHMYFLAGRAVGFKKLKLPSPRGSFTQLAISRRGQ